MHAVTPTIVTESLTRLLPVSRCLHGLGALKMPLAVMQQKALPKNQYAASKLQLLQARRIEAENRACSHPLGGETCLSALQCGCVGFENRSWLTTNSLSFTTSPEDNKVTPLRFERKTYSGNPFVPQRSYISNGMRYLCVEWYQLTRELEEFHVEGTNVSRFGDSFLSWK